MKRALFVAACVLIGLVAGGGARAQTTVSIGSTNTAADVTNFIADKRGYFAAEGITAKFVRFDAAARMIAPMASGELDVGGGGISAGLFNAVARGIGLKIVADRSTAIKGAGTGAIMVRKALVDSGAYSSPRDLKGRKLAIPAPGTGTSTSIAFVGALNRLVLKKVAVLATYPEPASRALAAFLGEYGITVTALRWLDAPSGFDAANIEADQLAAALARTDLGGAEAVLIPDTALPSLDVIERLEGACRLPVLTANQVTIWAALGLARKPLVVPGYGKLFTVACNERLP